MTIIDLARRLLREKTAAVSTMLVVLLPILAAMTGMVVEHGFGVLRKSQLQNVADAAAFSAAVAYNATIDNNGNANAAMSAAADRVAAFNAVQAGNVAVALVNSPSGDGNPAVSVTLSDNIPIVFSRLLTGETSLPVNSRSTVELTQDSRACIVSLQAAAGSLAASVGLDGGAVINALLCAVTANAAVTVPCGTGINTARLSFNSALPPDQPCNGIQAPAGQVLQLLQKQVTDPYALDASVTTAHLRATTDTLLLSPLPPVVVALGNIDFGSSALTTMAQALAVGCNATLSSTVWTLTCNSSTPRFGSITVASGYTVNFNTGSSALVQYGFSGSITNSGVLTFGSGSFAVAAGIRTAIGSSTSFGSGSLSVGAPLLSACADGYIYSVCNAGTLAITGATALTLSAGFYNAAAARATLGSGTGNSYYFGSGLSGNAVRTGSGSTTVFADGNGDYKFAGNVLMDNGGVGGSAASTGNSCLIIGAAANHDINGSLKTANATIFGAGTYTVSGAVLLGVNGASDAPCGGTTTGVSAVGVTFVANGGLGVPLGGPCALQAFCVAPGYNNVAVTAPTDGLLAKVAVIGPALNASGALFSSGLNNTSLSGLFYVPLGPVSIDGGAGVGNGLGQCLELVVAQLLVKHGSIFAAPCKNGGPVFRSQRFVA